MAHIYQKVVVSSTFGVREVPWSAFFYGDADLNLGRELQNLIEFSVGNFRSFKLPARLSMVASKKLVSRDPAIDNGGRFVVNSELSLLRSAAIYGANASGKSNLLAGLRFMRGMVLNSSKETAASQPIAVQPFLLSSATSEEPSFFEVVFLLDDTQYRYGFEADRHVIKAEWLLADGGKGEKGIFTRELDRISLFGTFRKEGKGLEERTRNNALFLSVVAQFNGSLAGRIQSWFSSTVKSISGLTDLGYLQYTVGRCESDEGRRAVVDFVRRMDVGIHDLLVSKIPVAESLPADMPSDLRNFILTMGEKEIAKIGSVHRRLNDSGEPVDEVMFEFDRDESEGTKKLFALAGPVLDTLQHGKVLLVDELDGRLHPLITIALVRLFNSPETNPKNAQLIFTTHDTNLLASDLLRRDQIWFTEKDRFGATNLYSLLEYKPRNDTSLAKNYIQGRYGAIPFIGDLGGLALDSDDEA